MSARSFSNDPEPEPGSLVPVTGTSPSRLESRLPQPLTPLIGRERELLVVQRLLQDPVKRLVTLTGPGGVGKTRLALQVATSMENAFPDGVLFVSLVSITDVALVSARIAQALGIQESVDEPLAARFRAVLGTKQVLLLVDNFEHVIEVSPLIADILTACPGLKVLSTSRVRLRISGEFEIVVPPLQLPNLSGSISPQEAVTFEAVRLFVERAQAVQHDFAITADNASAVCAVCDRVDGLPLAIELAASRVKVLPPRVMRERLERQLPLLTGGGRDMPARQRTMRDTIAWSHDLLGPAERMLFRRLAVFMGGCSLAATEAVADPEGKLGTIERLAALVDQSLVRQETSPDGEPRYGMLETVREFGVEQLIASGEEAEVRSRHAAWCLRTAMAAGNILWTRYDPQVVEPLEADLANLRAARTWLIETGDTEAVLQLASALGYFLYLARHYREGREWMEEALAVNEAPRPERARVLLWSGILSLGLGDDDAATCCFQQSAGLAHQLDLPGVEGIAVLGQGILLEDRAQYNAAEELLTRALTLLRKARIDVVVPQAIYHLGVVAYGQGETKRARQRWEEALAMARGQGNPVAVSWCLEYLGLQAAEQGDVERSAVALVEVVDQLDATMHRHQREDLLATLAVLGGACGTYETAARLFGAAHAATASGHTPTPPEATAYERAAQRIRSALGSRVFEHAFAIGQQQGNEAIAADAREVIAVAMSSGWSSPDPDGHGLTPRERDVLRLLAKGHSNEEIGQLLFISPRTAQTHITHLLSKLGLTNRTEAAAFAHQHQLI